MKHVLEFNWKTLYMYFKFTLYNFLKKNIPFKKIFNQLKPPFTGCSSLIWNIIVFANLGLGFRCNNVYLLKMSCLIIRMPTSI